MCRCLVCQMGEVDLLEKLDILFGLDSGKISICGDILATWIFEKIDILQLLGI